MRLLGDVDATPSVTAAGRAPDRSPRPTAHDASRQDRGDPALFERGDAGPRPLHLPGFPPPAGPPTRVCRLTALMPSGNRSTRRFMPRPSTIAQSSPRPSGSTSPRIPAQLAALTRTSFGHLRPAPRRNQLRARRRSPAPPRREFRLPRQANDGSALTRGAPCRVARPTRGPASRDPRVCSAVRQV